MLTYKDIIEATDEPAPDVPADQVQGIVIPATDRLEDIIERVPLPRQSLWIKSSDLLPSGLVIVMGKRPAMSLLWPEPTATLAIGPVPLAFYRWKPQLRGNTCPQCGTGPLRRTHTEDFIIDGWRGQRWHYHCKHCEWIGSEEIAVGPYKENERD
jgi:hypothetical protein